MLLAVGDARELGDSSQPWLRFGEAPKAEGTWAGRRLLWVNEEPAFELSFWCGTCPFLFRRLEGSRDTASIDFLQERLADGIDGIDEDVLQQFGPMLPAGSYVPMLLQIQPRLVSPGRPGDYFSDEQVDTWGVSAFWGLPEYPATPYYRTYETAVHADAHVFEFVVPMVPPSWNRAERVAAHSERLAASSRPTAVAVSTLDICQPAMNHGVDYCAHWGLTHFLLDGHHKLQAAADSGRPLQLLSLLSIDESLASATDVAAVAQLRARPSERRPSPPSPASRPRRI